MNAKIDDVLANFAKLQLHVEQLDQGLRATYMRAVDMDERERCQRWHATHNAALQGLLAASDNRQPPTVNTVVEYAAAIANLVHGPLP